MEDAVFRLVIETPKPEVDGLLFDTGHTLYWWYKASGVQSRRYRTLGGARAVRTYWRRYDIEMRVERMQADWVTVDD